MFNFIDIKFSTKPFVLTFGLLFVVLILNLLTLWYISQVAYFSGRTNRVTREVVGLLCPDGECRLDCGGASGAEPVMLPDR